VYYHSLKELALWMVSDVLMMWIWFQSRLPKGEGLPYISWPSSWQRRLSPSVLSVCDTPPCSFPSPSLPVFVSSYAAGAFTSLDCPPQPWHPH
jgi:hypothetical protein